MKQIPLTQGQFAIVDDADYEWLNQWKWYAHKNYNTFYAVRKSKTVNGKRDLIRMHIEIIGKKEGLITDHINGDGLDNQRHNLRHVTYRQNQQNLHAERSSRFPGVGWFKATGKWRGRVRIGGRLKHLGYFVSETDAFKAYCNAINELGEAVL